MNSFGVTYVLYLHVLSLGEIRLDLRSRRIFSFVLRARNTVFSVLPHARFPGG